MRVDHPVWASTGVTTSLLFLHSLLILIPSPYLVFLLQNISQSGIYCIVVTLKPK